MPNTPIINAGFLYVNGLNIAQISNTAINMSAGAARNSTNINDIILKFPVHINGQERGVNGLDSGQLLPNKFYAVYVIGDSNFYEPTAGLFSLNYIEPKLPLGYDIYRRVGWVGTDGSSNILSFFQNGDSQERMYYYQEGILVLVLATATIFTPINLSNAVPSIATNVLCNLTYDSHTPFTGTAQFLPFGNTALSSALSFGYGIPGDQVGMITIPCALDNLGIPKILYKVTAGDTLSMVVAGFKDRIN